MSPAHSTATCDLGYAFVFVDYRTGAVQLTTGGPAKACYPTAVRIPPSPASWGTQEVPFGLPPLARVPRVQTALATVALTLVLTVQHVGRKRHAFFRLIHLIRLSTRRTSRSASAVYLEQTLNAVRRAAFAFPCRVACLEESTAVMLVLGAQRMSARWCHGITTDPISLHAWVQTLDGDKPAEPPSTDRYTPIRTIPDNNEEPQ